MSPSSSLIKSLCILCLLFVSASAGFFDYFPHHAYDQDPEHGNKNENNVDNYKPKNKAREDFPGFVFHDENNEDNYKPKKKPKNKAREAFPGFVFHDENNEDNYKPKKKPKNKSKKKPTEEAHEGFPGFDFGPGFPGFGPRDENPRLGDDEEEEKKQQQQQPAGEQQEGGQQGEVVETAFPGKWEMVSQSSGVSAMHLQLMPNNKLIMFDATSLGKSNIQLAPGNCRPVPKTADMDCFAHSVEYDPETNQVRVLKVTTDPWCSSGGLSPDGTLVGTGGWADGEKTIRHMPSCATCDWTESNMKLADNRWYATQTLLGDGRFVVIGGRRAFNYEFLSPQGIPVAARIDLPFLRDTTDLYENNLYPFVHVAPNGNLFILANNRAILLDVNNNKIVRNYPDLPGGARNYPGSGSSAILPIDLKGDNNNMDIEVLVCGGGEPTAFGKAEKEGIFLPALDTCGRIKVLDPGSQWEIEKMPSPRVMGDMLNLPNGEILLLNGAKKGASGWQFADDPNLTPVLYSPNKPAGQRFKNLNPTQIPRMYHASSAVLPDGKILLAGSNTNPAYQFNNVKFPTELRVEKFSPPYLDPELTGLRPVVGTVTKVVGYRGTISVGFKTSTIEPIQETNLMVSLYQPPFTTHGYSMNQRLLNLAVSKFDQLVLGNYKVQVEAPANGDLAPPGYYLLFVNHKGVPSQGSWIKLQ